MKIAIGGDHAGYELKAKVIEHLKGKGHEVINYGVDTAESVDYPDFVKPVGRDVQEGNVDFGIVICGSGNGVNITVNKFKGVRSVLCWLPELAALGRQHNNANVLALPARYIDEATGLGCVDAFLENEFEGGRHQRRVEKIEN